MVTTRRILLDNLRVQASIGILEHERLQRQPLIVRMDCETDATDPVDDEDITSVLDYRQLRAVLRDEIERQHTNLLESLVDRTLDRLLREFPDLMAVRLRICKPQAFDDCDAVCIEQSRRRTPQPAD